MDTPTTPVAPAVKFYLQVADEPHWELVDEFTFQHWEKARDTTDGKRRYNGNGVSHSKEGISIRCVAPLTADDIARIARFTNAGHNLINVNYSMPGGIVREPDFIPMILRSKPVLREVKSGKSWRCQS